MSHLEFTLALHRAIAGNPTEQVCWSPYSVASALGLLALGARGGSRRELVELFGDLDDLTTLIAGAATLDKAGTDEDEPVIAVTNTLWADASVRVESSFADELSRWSDGSVRNAPFRTEPVKARDEINADVAETTRGLIPELLPEGSINSDTVSALVNALYLKCAWRNKFSEFLTEPKPFHTAAGVVEVPTMALNESVPYAATSGWQVVGLPAIGGVEAVILLPDGDLADAEPELTAESLGALLNAPEHRQVALSLPKLKVSTQAELSPALRSVGVREVFGDQADLSGISPDPLAVEAILHESVLKIDEQGFEGAAATAVMMRMLSMPAEPLPVVVDKPFLLLVRHAGTGAVYFMARVTDPS
ncbi:Serine protease inhibitor (serpin family) [Alloactinosynnema sp. L-07]|uniref:serpin family protein n=1 Tax=Alloactinosynnema sp. L-07 TaxID=1653480 RepID=UPI00065F07FC|nr:serpin family protein [Alloactinosynnema sp. L-07]CRK55574.1 Serine protease inhibitor (serpin family) [Alloactinosynnema sp. L-07]